MVSRLTTCALALLTFVSYVQAHSVITYPGWRGNNLHSNGTVNETFGLQPYPAANSTGNGYDMLWPYGMQWAYPCGGMPLSQNRTKWPVQGGAFAFQPGWFQGHSQALIYVNLCVGTNAPNCSNVMTQGLQIVGPTNQPYPGTVCLPQVPLPVNQTFKVGENATIQLIETAQHGAALYNCVDITFAEPEDVEEVTPDNCFNSSQINFRLWYTTTDLISNDANSLMAYSSRMTYITAVLAVVLTLFVL